MTSATRMTTATKMTTATRMTTATGRTTATRLTTATTGEAASTSPIHVLLDKLKFELSNTQKSTPADGNCMYHVLADQASFKDHGDARLSICSNIYAMVDDEKIFWGEEKPISQWIDEQLNCGVFGDHYSLQVAANLLGRDIIIIPTRMESSHNPYGYILIDSFELKDVNPVYMLYYEESIYGAGHYQSIREDIIYFMHSFHLFYILLYILHFILYPH